MTATSPHYVTLALAIWLACPALLAVAAFPPVQEPGASQATLQQIAQSLERGDLEAASRVIEPALKAHPSDPVLHNLAGVVAAQRDEVESAEAHFQAAIRLAPKSPAAYENMGRLYQERADGNPAMRAKAIAVYRQLLEVEPASVEGLFQSGFVLALDGQFAASRAMLERLSGEIGRSPRTQAVLAADLAGLGDTAGAQRVITSLAGDPALTEADVLSVLPVLPAGSGDPMAALMLEALSQRKLMTGPGLRALAAIYVRGGRPADARGLLERAVTVGGASAPLLVELARTAITLKDFQGALGYLAHARSLDPANPTIHFLFGMVCVEENLGREAYRLDEEGGRARSRQPADQLCHGGRGDPSPRTVRVAAVLQEIRAAQA